MSATIRFVVIGLDEAGEEVANMTDTPCGGCGETNPRRRCLGCMHPFTPDDWPTKRKEVER